MRGHFFLQSQMPPRLLFKFARGVGHVEATTSITDRQAVRKDVLAKPDGHIGNERLHKTIAKHIPGNNVRMARTEDQIAVRMDPRPVKRHETALVAKRVEVIGE